MFLWVTYWLLAMGSRAYNPELEAAEEFASLDSLGLMCKRFWTRSAISLLTHGLWLLAGGVSCQETRKSIAWPMSNCSSAKYLGKQEQCTQAANFVRENATATRVHCFSIGCTHCLQRASLPEIWTPTSHTPMCALQKDFPRAASGFAVDDVAFDPAADPACLLTCSSKWFFSIASVSFSSCSACSVVWGCSSSQDEKDEEDVSELVSVSVSASQSDSSDLSHLELSGAIGGSIFDPGLVDGGSWDSHGNRYPENSTLGFLRLGFLGRPNFNWKGALPIFLFLGAAAVTSTGSSATSTRDTHKLCIWWTLSVYWHSLTAKTEAGSGPPHSRSSWNTCWLVQMVWFFDTESRSTKGRRIWGSWPSVPLGTKMPFTRTCIIGFFRAGPMK